MSLLIEGFFLSLPSSNLFPEIAPHTSAAIPCHSRWCLSLTHILLSSEAKSSRVLHLPTFSSFWRRWKASMINLFVNQHQEDHPVHRRGRQKRWAIPACLVRTSSGAWKAAQCWRTSLAAGSNGKKPHKNLIQLPLFFFVHQNKTLKLLIYLSKWNLSSALQELFSTSVSPERSKGQEGVDVLKRSTASACPLFNKSPAGKREMGVYFPLYLEK